MIGRIENDAGAAAEMGDDGAWSAADPALAEALNALFGPADAATGDHHRGFGVARLGLAAKALGAKATYARPPLPPLPPGAVS